MNKLQKFSNQELLKEVKVRIISGEIEIEWEVSINSLSYYDVKQKKRVCVSFKMLRSNPEKK